MKNKGFTLAELLIVIILVTIIPCIIIIGLVFWTDRSLDYWATIMAGAPRDVPMWMSVIATIVLNGVTIAFNIITEILRVVRGG